MKSAETILRSTCKQGSVR